MKEIKELDDKYLVLKWEDINRTEALNPNLRGAMNAVITSIDIDRSLREPPKTPSRKNEYLVLNLDDDIDLGYFVNKRYNTRWLQPLKVKISDIAIDLVNAILKAKDKQ